MWEYLTVECNPEDLQENLTTCGRNGWEFVTLLMMQKLIENKFSLEKASMAIMQFKLIFKKPIV